ncbi:unnamed protein product [Arabidopsis arenosa]|uniref:Uncharacterized protein n=2 Tax=Arabidopsis TaxID=3701 RepID=A0A8T1XKJ0_9BRAS|nr:hypothetical protein ISN45_Aa08g018740 [Arabidopsis thaliana x Arabidopsis arenosa]CAE5958713.1 unnamed protein product [Arabidopsis arenosa]
MTSKNSGLSAALVSNLQDVLSKRKVGNEEKVGSDGSAEEAPYTSDSVDVAAVEEEIDDSGIFAVLTN